MDSALPTRHPGQIADRVGRFIADYARWFNGMNTPCPELADLYAVYVKLVVVLTMQSRCADCYHTLDALAGHAEITSDAPGYLAPGDCMDSTERALAALAAEGVVRAAPPDEGGGAVGFALNAPGCVTDPGDPLGSWVQLATLEAWAQMARVEAACVRVAAPRPAADLDVRVCRDYLTVLDRLMARPGEWVRCPERRAAWELANAETIERDGHGRHRVADVPKAERRRAEMVAFLATLGM